MNELCGAKCETVKQHTIEDHVYELLDELNDKISTGNILIDGLEDRLSSFLYDDEPMCGYPDEQKSTERPRVVEYLSVLIDKVDLHNDQIGRVIKRTEKQ